MPVPSPRVLYRGLRNLLRFLARPVRRAEGRGARVIQCYRGYGSRQELFLIGRVFRQPGLGLDLAEGPLNDLVNVGRRTVRWGIGGARVRVRALGSRDEVKTDGDGYFTVRLPIQDTLPAESSWQTVRLTLLPERDSDEPANADAKVYIPPADVDLAVVSDIDDTVMFTGVANKLWMLYRLFVEKARHRTAFPGVSALYRALFQGLDGERRRPMLYVSRAPWTIYEMLSEFFHLNRIPHGPILFLREWGLTLQRPWPRRAKDHKALLIRRMMALYQQLPFVLIGDSGQRDPEVYAQIVAEHPGRVKAIYIRHVHQSPSRDREIHRLARQVSAQGCEMILARNSLEMASHAHRLGLISDAGLQEVRADSQRRQQD